MLIYVKPTNAEIVDCPYIPEEKFRQRYAILKDLNQEDFEMMLINGWRHFGYYFFMPNCTGCNKCRPIRTIVNSFTPSKSQRRNFRKNDPIIEVSFEPLVYTDEIFEVYKKHSKVKFNQDSNIDEFKDSFFSDALLGNSKLSLYKLDGKLIGVGFIDISLTGVSSIYFCYDTDYSKFGIGVYSVLKEIEYAKSLGKEFYYLGYYIKENRSMEYKASYTPYEILDWDRAMWLESITDHIVSDCSISTLK